MMNFPWILVMLVLFFVILVYCFFLRGRYFISNCEYYIVFSVLGLFLISAGFSIAQLSNLQIKADREDQVKLVHLKNHLKNLQFKQVQLQADLTNHPDQKAKIKATWESNDQNINDTQKQIKYLDK